MDELLAMLGMAGSVLDTPGRFARTALSGRNPFASIFNPEQGSSGRDMLETWGVLDPNTEGFDAGDVAGFGAEVLTDPLNLLGGALLGRTARAAGRARKSNAASEIMRAKGYMPEEIATSGARQIPVFRGDQGMLDDGKHLSGMMDPMTFINRLSGREVKQPSLAPIDYFTESEQVAARYADRDASIVNSLKWHVPDPTSTFTTLHGHAPRSTGTVTKKILVPNNTKSLEVLGENVEYHDLMEALLATEGSKIPVYGNASREIFEDLAVGDLSLDEAARFLGDLWPDIKPLTQDLSSKVARGEMAVMDARDAVSRQIGINSDQYKRWHELDNEFNISDMWGDDKSIPIWNLLKNQGNSLRGSKVAEWMKGLGHDAMSFAENGTTNWAVFDPRIAYSPYIAPTMRDVPKLTALLSALGGYNTAMLPQRVS